MTASLEIRFPGGSYHATPWGSHVNEGLIEWPPSPWRLLRALLAVGFSRLGWTAVPPLGGALLGKLASALPTVWLPPAAAAHTRHYMPPFKGNTTKVLDAFAHVGAGERLVVDFDVTLTDEERALLGSLAEHLPYLGRAESWVEARLVVDPDRTGLARADCRASEPPTGGCEPIRLLAPLGQDEIAQWREHAIAEAITARTSEEAAKAHAKGKPFKALSAKDQTKLAASFPATVVEALLQDTPSLRAAGWSQPPGSRWVIYWRPTDALAVRAVTLSSPRETDAKPTMALFALSSDNRRKDVLPPRTDTLRRLDLVHRALVWLSDDKTSTRGPSPCFTGKRDGQPLSGHRHAYLLPLTLGPRPDRLDHILVYAADGFDADARRALRSLNHTFDQPTLFLTLVGMGRTEDFAARIREAAQGTRWRSVTPFVPSRHLKAKGKDTLLEQVRAECGWRGLPMPEIVEVATGKETFAPAEDVVVDRGGGLCVLVDGVARALPGQFRGFHRRRHDRPPPADLGVSLRLTFSSAVGGPLALGYGSHFGLGLFQPGDGEVSP